MASAARLAHPSRVSAHPPEALLGEPAYVLVVDDDVDLAEVLASSLARIGHRVQVCASAAEARARVASEDVDLVVTDVRMPGEDGLALCRHLVESRPDLPVILLTGFGSMEAAVQALRLGAFDFLTKPVDRDVLRLSVARALSHRRLHRRIQRLEAVRETGDELLPGASDPMRQLRELVARVAPHASSVLVMGESGTGKELVARALHVLSGRRGAFVALNCAAVPENLLESELFGHVKGAFTDARADHVGLFVQAHGGTLFLDEIGELPLPLQAKLLRTLQERTVRPLGSAKEHPFDARIVAATNRNLEALVREGRFREDLLYRLQVVTLELPPLRARGRDVLLLAERFRREIAETYGKPVREILPAAAEAMLAYPWPGNVRELRNAIERAIALARHDVLSLEDLPERVTRRAPPAQDALPIPLEPSMLPSMDAVERRYILHVMERTGWNKSLAARILGFDRKTLYRKLERYELEDPAEAPESA
ncbi:MAG: sigma-54-dependent Fis family transcriptional regulator [Myxococcales bacterium]|nr:sigma-54-dependent Fis family transcriptional regulator [Myxococcales bacterium]